MTPRGWLAAAAAVGALLTESGCRRHSVDRTALPPPPPAAEVTFRDRAEEAGIEFALGHAGRSPLSILDTAPGGCALVDLDRDGWPDIVLVGPSHCAVYRNLHNGRFQDVTREMGLDATASWMGCTVGDYDNDGYPDLLLTGYRRLALFHNEGGKRFRNVTAASGLQTGQWTTSAAFCDVDGDGWLDLYVGAYVDYHVGTKDLCRMGSISSACGPEMYGPERGHLYRNAKHGRFVDVTAASGLERASGKTWGVAFADYDGDGKPDLYLANDQTAGNLFHNRGGCRFEDVGTVSGTAFSARGTVQGGMGVDWGDVDGDGRLDLFVATYAHQVKEIYLNSGGSLFHPAGEERGLAAATDPWVAFGGGFLDANNDGDLDLFIANGHVRDNARVLEATQQYAQPLQLFLNHRGRFTEVSATAGEPFRQPMVGRGVAFGDYDNDGRQDLLVVDLEGRARLLHNEGGPHMGCGIDVGLESGGANRFGIGARISLEGGGRTQVRELTCGRSVLSASDSRAHFGLGSGTRIDRIDVRWPDGRREEWRDLPLTSTRTLRRGSGRTASNSAAAP